MKLKSNLKSQSTKLVTILCLLAFSLGCSMTTPNWLKQVHWKKVKTPVDLAMDHYEAGLKYENDGNRAKAITEYEAAQKLSPRPVVAYKLGLLYAAQGNYDLAKTNFQKAIELEPNYEDAKKELATLQASRSPVSTDTTSK